MALLNEHIEGKYEILEKIREGGMGAIYKVRHRLLDEVRVVKVIRSQSDPEGEGGERFLREARSAIKLRHPNIAVLHDFAIADDGQAFIVMELIDGWNLLEVLSGYGPPPISLTLEIARQSLKALGYLHRQKIVHRDVSPDNLMLARDVDGNPLVKLIDLGIAKTLEGQGGLTTTGVFLGKPRYGSPERLSGEGWDERSDLYSFGVVLYELLTGRCPISGSEPAALMAGHLFRPPLDFAESDPQGKVPPELRQIVLKALAKKPAERTASAEEFVWELTMLQDRFPLTRQDLEGVWRVLLPLPATASHPVRPGSTQDRLNLEFGLDQTPPPSLLTVVPAPEPEPTRRLAEETRATPDTIALPVRPSRSVAADLDATWASRPLRKDSDPPAPPVPAEAPPVRGAAVVKPSRSRALLAGAALVVLGLAGAGIWWGLRPEEIAPAAPVPAPVEEVEEATETVAAPASAIAPATIEPLPQAEPEIRKAVIPEKKTPAEPPPPLAPMEPGALILAGQPGVEPPEVWALPSYTYPEAAKGSGRKVSVGMEVLVDEDGRVIDARLRRGDSSGLGFNEAALEAAHKTRFVPATRDGIAGKMWTELYLEFAE
ncbi:MAG TPA: TonB family protein [Thermoanaerobaculia bacterium]|nr:TonB family protein [Thermoanaerobaculia bacterium]